MFVPERAAPIMSASAASTAAWSLPPRRAVSSRDWAASTSWLTRRISMGDSTVSV